MAEQSLSDRFGSAKRPDRPPAHERPQGASDELVSAVGKLSAAFEVVENARGHLYAFHRMSGEADLALQEATKALREAGQSSLADEIDDVLVGRDVIDGKWTFQLIEAYDQQYFAVFQAVEAQTRQQLMHGVRHVFEAEMKIEEQSGTAD